MTTIEITGFYQRFMCNFYLTFEYSMAIPKNKTELLNQINMAYDKLIEDLNTIPTERTREIGIEGNVKGTQISVCDVVSYLIEWGKLVLKWHSKSLKNELIDFPETGYNWNQLGELAQSFQKKHSNDSYQSLLQLFNSTVNEIILVIKALDNDKLYLENWYKIYSFGRMIQLNTSSPYKTARTKIRRWKKQNL